MSPQPALAVLLALALSPVVAPPGLVAQEPDPPDPTGTPAAEAGPTGILAGEVVDAESGDPLRDAHVRLAEPGISAGTNRNGRFFVEDVPEGRVTVRVERIGYATVEDTVEVRAAMTTEVKVKLSTEPIPLDPIVVTAVRRSIELPGLVGFERRYHSGWGDFILEEEIRARSPMRLTDMLWEKGLEVTGNGAQIKSRRGNCSPAVYLDGVRISPRITTRGASGGSNYYQFPDPTTSPAAEAAAAVNLLTPSSILAVEVYRSRLETPGEYADHYAHCGVILVWSRRGLPLRGGG